MPVITIKDAIRMALEEEMNNNASVFLMGEDIGVYGGAFGVTAGLFEKFGQDRVMDTPISEGSLMGVAVGAALLGMRPIFEVMFMDFTTLIMDQVLNHAVKFKYMFGGGDDINVPLVIRTPYGGGRAYGASHSQSLEGFFMHIPGLKIIAPSTPVDAYALLKAAVRDDNPVLFIENKLLYKTTGEVSKTEKIGEIGKAAIRRHGDEITFLSYGRMLNFCLEAACELEKEEITCEVVDLRTLAPLDIETISSSVEKTGRMVVVEEGTLTGGVGAEICSRVMEKSFFSLEAPPKRVAAMDLPIPYSPNLEAAVLPSVGKIIKAAREVLAH